MSSSRCIKQNCIRPRLVGREHCTECWNQVLQRRTRRRFKKQGTVNPVLAARIKRDARHRNRNRPDRITIRQIAAEHAVIVSNVEVSDRRPLGGREFLDRLREVGSDVGYEISHKPSHWRLGRSPAVNG